MILAKLLGLAGVFGALFSIWGYIKYLKVKLARAEQLLAGGQINEAEKIISDSVKEDDLATLVEQSNKLFKSIPRDPKD